MEKGKEQVKDQYLAWPAGSEQDKPILKLTVDSLRGQRYVPTSVELRSSNNYATRYLSKERRKLITLLYASKYHILLPQWKLCLHGEWGPFSLSHRSGTISEGAHLFQRLAEILVLGYFFVVVVPYTEPGQ